MPGTRKKIPDAIAAAVLLANRHACCVCQKFQVQLHHIDGNNNHSTTANLASLCLEHHDQASMNIGLTRKLTADAVRLYKSQWESRCAVDVEALAKDRLRFYAAIYKNPPRIRELFGSLSRENRLRAVGILVDRLNEDMELHKSDGGFKWQAIPGENDLTKALLFSLRAGELWPRVLPRVDGHPKDPDYPINLAPPDGMLAFHGFDLYCQLMVRTLAILSPPKDLESLWALRDPQLIDQFSGHLVSFREVSIGKNIRPPSVADDLPLGRVQFKVQRNGIVYQALMDIKNMYVFSDTAAHNLERSKVCGIGLLEDSKLARKNKRKEIHIALKPLLIGIGGYGMSVNGLWDLRQGILGSQTLL